ncbi:hypothetical protein [Nonomuraea sp. NPDC049784]|uniref:hypothetical protein n=1 Tax=Nonomuraea sp. NPDC049784 TaxID=3154361 RepID=UPI0033F23219
MTAAEIPLELARRRLTPRLVLIYGRRDNYVGSRRRQEKRAELARADERLMSFDRLTPTKDGVLFSCVRKEQDGYRVVAVPPCLTIFNDGEDYQHVSGWEQALDACLDMAHSRREYLKNQLRLLTESPEAHVQASGGLRFRRPQWL